jgi:hypothetical protein
MTLKIAGVALFGLIAGLAVAALMFIGSDLPRAQFVRQYADVNSRFVRLPDGSAAHRESAYQA